MAPYIAPIPRVLPILINGETVCTAEPITTGIAIPVYRVPLTWNKVPIAVIKMSAEIKYAICCALKCNAAPINNGTKIPPEYIARTCCNPKIRLRNLLKRPVDVRVFDSIT